MVKRDLVTQVLVIILILVALLGVRLYFLEPYTVTSKDANAYIQAHQVVLAVKTKPVDYKDLVLYEVDGKKQIGRVIAKSGDSVTYMDDVLYLNQAIQEETYLTNLKEAYHQSVINGESFTPDFSIQSLTETVDGVIPEKEYLILNDQRTNTADSRSYGLIKENQLIGVVSFRVSPFSDFGFIDAY